MESTTPSLHPKVNYGLWVIMMCQHEFLSCNKCPTLVSKVVNGRGYACVGAEGVWEIAVPSTQFCCEPKAAL